jgi:hypothetical protein
MKVLEALARIAEIKCNRQPVSPRTGKLHDLARRRRGVTLIKRVLALLTQLVCRRELAITADGIETGAARERRHHHAIELKPAGPAFG